MRHPSHKKSWRLLALAFASALALALSAQARADEVKKAGAADAPSAQTGASTPAPTEAGAAKRVLYLPESVKEELREEIKREVLEQARKERWASPNAIPDWVNRIRFNGDLRTRFERDSFPHGNAVGLFPDFNTINNNGPTDDNGNDVSNDRYLNVNRSVSRERLRARLGLDADVTEGVTAGLRFGTGDQGSGVSSNQTLGASGGFFSKYQFWLDRAFINMGSEDRFIVHLGRFENPFFATDSIWSENVSFDGLALRSTQDSSNLSSFVTAGAFPLYTTAFNFPAQSAEKFGSFDKWLWALQLGTDWRPLERFHLKLAGALYYFTKVQGRLGEPCDTNLKYITCSSDDSRPAYAQKGNTYMRLRTPSAAALAAEASSNATPRYQYWGLAARFEDLVVTGRADVGVTPSVKAWIDGEYVRNLGYSARRIAPVAVNNCAQASDGTCGKFLGGPNGYLGRVSFGSVSQQNRWDWSVALTYRYLESDAVVDAFTDSDFGLGGTNLRGFIVGGNLYLFDRVWTSARYLSADEVTGPPFKSDIFMVDVSTRF